MAKEAIGSYPAPSSRRCLAQRDTKSKPPRSIFEALSSLDDAFVIRGRGTREWWVSPKRRKSRRVPERRGIRRDTELKWWGSGICPEKFHSDASRVYFCLQGGFSAVISRSEAFTVISLCVLGLVCSFLVLTPCYLFSVRILLHLFLCLVFFLL